MQKTQVEKERKFLLRNIPVLAYDHKISIKQGYFQEDGATKRVRRSRQSGSPELTFELIRKETLSPGHNIEHHEPCSEHQFIELYSLAERTIIKTRAVYKYKGLKFEVDIFDSIRLIMLEVEVYDLDRVIDFPEEIADMIIMEVTAFKEFGNYNLAT